MKARTVTAQRRWQTICLFGESGVGKTTLASTAPKPIFLDSNKGLLSIANRGVKAVDVNGMSDLDAAYDNFTGTGDEDWKKQYQTIVFDHFDDMQSIILDELVEKAMAKDERRDDSVEQREYGILFNKLSRYLRKFKSIPCHKILICGMGEDFDTGQARPSLVGQMKHKLKYLVDHTIYVRMNPKTGARFLHLDPSDDYYAKTRAFWLPKEQRKIKVNFNDRAALSKLFELIAAGPNESNRSVEK